ncbi:MAG TPA: Xaa-Pro peptidase family protein, partial [Candidatus Saccharimonadales bacterium]|nr:Xaa-Pro peptidase family protein [Candidatus Saccharimonadales bacterium]
MKEYFGPEFFSGNRERLRQLFTGTAPIVLTANGLLQRASDEAYPFHQDRSFWYLTGIAEPDIMLVMDKQKEYLIVPARESVREAFDGAVDPQALSRISGIQTVLNDKEGWKQLEARLKKVQHVATLAAGPAYLDAWGLYTNPARASVIKRMKEANPSLELLDLRQHLAKMRAVKQPPELAAIQSAIDITVDTLKEVTRSSSLAKYGFEYELEADITRGFRRRGADGHAFEPIVAGGPRACTLHNVANNHALASGELVVLDVGASVQNYAADITRTVVLGGKPSRRQEQIYTAVQEAQTYACGLLKPGTVLKEYEKQMEQFMGEKLRELGLIKTIDKETVRRYFPHATSH